jgi:hypothetical protein
MKHGDTSEVLCLCASNSNKALNTLLYQKGFQETVLQWWEKDSGNAEATPLQSLTFSFVRVI